MFRDFTHDGALLVMGFYDVSARDNRTIKNPMPSRPVQGRFIKAHDKHL